MDVEMVKGSRDDAFPRSHLPRHVVLANPK
jgi:hypothetical protein